MPLACYHFYIAISVIGITIQSITQAEKAGIHVISTLAGPVVYNS